MSAPDNEDPVWHKIKAQTKPLKKKQTAPFWAQKPAKQNLNTKQNPIVNPAASKPAPPKKPAITLKPDRREVALDVHKKTRRGQIEIQAKIDLHGLVEKAARGQLLDFLEQKQREQVGTVLVVTGKGEHGRGVLRQSLPIWFAQPDFIHILSRYAPAHPRHGGAGAWYVFIRKKRS